MGPNLIDLQILETHCKIIANCKYIKSIADDDINVVLLSVYNLQKLLNDQNLLIAVNMTKIDDCYLKNLCEILHFSVCIKDNKQKFLNFLLQFNIQQNYLQKHSLLIPYDVIVNNLSSNTVNYNWQHSVSSIATTEYIFMLIFKELNKHSVSVKLDEDLYLVTKMLELLSLEEYNSVDIEKGITDTIQLFNNMFDILYEVFFSQKNNI